MIMIDKAKLVEELVLFNGEHHEKADTFEEEIGFLRGFNAVLEIIKAQPTSDGWIPVSSEEKPKDDEYYIITTNDGLVECAHRYNRRWYTEEATCGWYSDKEILAYMPLPQPYKESE